MWCKVRQYCQVEDRFDPFFYGDEYLAIERLLESSKRIGDIARLVTKGETPLWRGDAYVESGIPLLRTSEVKDGSLDLSEVVYIEPHVHQRMKRSQLQPGDVLLSMAGTIGLAAIVPPDLGEANINQDLARIVLRDYSRTNPEYVALFLNSRLGRMQTDRRKNGTTRFHINFEAIKAVKIPIPSLERQQEIVGVMQAAYAERDMKLQEAEGLMKEIDDFVMQALGIQFEEPEPQPAFRSEYRMFSDRMEVEYYRPQFSLLEQALEECDYPLVSLGHIVSFIRNGIDCRDYVKVGTPYIRVADVSKDGQIDVRGVRQIAMRLDDLDDTLRLKEGDILFTRKGTPGNVAVERGETQNAIISSEIILLRLRNIIDPEYFEVFMNSLPGHRQVLRNTRGALNVGINHPTLLRLRIPLPEDKRNQRTIAEGVYDRRRRAQELKTQAEQLIRKAKAKVETMILDQE